MIVVQIAKADIIPYLPQFDAIDTILPTSRSQAESREKPCSKRLVTVLFSFLMTALKLVASLSIGPDLVKRRKCGIILCDSDWMI